ncbi:2029_t:CDS:2 [Funneliformis mosseae]|uniref:2029_t:CDS:1 n=1 Tax=Funneliformis mosseae TaxID=27381 RepID=A0A9N9D2F3_FUNMO|nr:2029_t:CDS:2 [Funneliformis mosseae]
MATFDTAHNYTDSFLGLATQLGISASISLYCLLQFEWNRRKKSMQYLYTPRTRLAKNPSPPIPSGLFSWIRATIFLSDEFYLKNVGLDALMYIRFLRMAFQFVLLNALTVGLILMPIHYTYNNKDGDKKEDDGVTRLSVSNISSDDINILWAHAVCTYIVSISWMFLSYKNYYDYMNLHRQHLMDQVSDGSISVRTVMVSRIHKDLRSEEKLQEFVSNLGLGEVESARMVRHTGKLDRKISRRENALLSLEKAHIQLAKNVCNAIKRKKLLGTGFWSKLFGYSSEIPTLALETGENQKIQNLFDWLDPRKKRRANTSEASENNENVIRHSKHSTSETFTSDDLMDREDGYGRQFRIWNALHHISKDNLDKFQPKHRTGFLGSKKRVYSIDHFLKKFNFLDRRIAELRSKSIQDPPYKATSTGFVTFKDHIGAQLCAQSIMCSVPHTCTTRMAPEPRDILWDNLTMSFKEKLFRYLFVNACVWALTIFWLFPIVAFLTLTSINSLSERFEFLKQFFLTSPTISTLLQNVLPTVLVSFFMAILPWILMEISKQESFSSYSELEEAVLIRYYHFSFFNVFLVFLLGITFLQSIVKVLDKPTSILDVLATNMPKGATFFINYIIFSTCTHGLELVQVGSQLFLHIILTSRFVSTTPRMLQRVTHPWSFQFYYYYPIHILILVITITYSVINPLILIFSLIYYATALVVFKHQFAYCYVRRYETGGKFYRRVFRYSTDGLIIFQLTMIGLIWLRKGIVVGAVLVPLLIGTGYFKYYCHKTFYSRTHYLALDSKQHNRVQNEQNEQSRNHVANTNENIGVLSEKVLIDSTEPSHVEKETAAENKGKTIKIKSSNIGGISNNKEGDIGIGSMFSRRTNGFSRLEGNDSTDSETSSFTSTKKDSVKKNVVIVDTIESNSQSSKDDVKNKNSKSSLEMVRISTEKSHHNSSDKVFNIQRSSSLPQFVILSNEQDKESANGTITSSIINLPTKLLKSKVALATGSTDNMINHDNSSGSSQIQEISTKANKVLTIVSPEARSNHLNVQIISPVGYSRHASRLPSRGNLRGCYHPAHFTHDPNLKVLQDETSTYQTYTHPNLVKALNRKLWLPRNPLKKISVEDNVELDKALTSSEGGPGIVGYWGASSPFLGEARVSIYGDHEFPSRLFHLRRATSEGENQNVRHERRCTEDGQVVFQRAEENIVSLKEFGSELAPGELSSGEEY